MKKIMIAGVFAFSISMPAMADDCWLTEDKPAGWSISSDRNYAFIKNGFQNMIICFGENDGTVTADNLQYVKVGQSTLVGWGTNEVGLEVVSVVQIDRINRKLLFTLNRIGTVRIGSAMPIRVDRAGVFTADVLPVSNRWSLMKVRPPSPGADPLIVIARSASDVAIQKKHAAA